MSWYFGVLGALEARYDGRRVPINAAKQRLLLASLLVDANRVVLMPELFRRMWGSGPPGGARNTVQNYVLRLRQRLAGPDQPVPLVTRSDGYLIAVPGDALDLHRFQRLVSEARVAMTENDAERAARQLTTALGLWRGEPFSDASSEVLEREFRPVLREQWLGAVGLRIDADLSLGRHAELITELHDLTARYPLVEAFWHRRMTALYRSGRVAEALDSFRTLSRVLVDELGIDPTPDLVDLHRAILNNDESLALRPVPRVCAGTEPRPPAGRNDLPAVLPDFGGRTAELTRIRTIAGRGGNTVVITGMPGSGKTALAVSAAHRLSGDFPDAQLYVDLHGLGDDQPPVEAAEALRILLGGVGVAEHRLPDGPEARAALWRAETANRRLIIVLDNATSAAQVRPLLPGAATCLVLITGRQAMDEIDGAHALPLEPMPFDAARALFASVVGAERADRQPDATGEILRRCGGLPLAVRVIAARMRARPTWTTGHLAARLTDDRRRLGEFTVGDRSVLLELTRSYAALPDAERRLYRLLAQAAQQHFGPAHAARTAGLDAARAGHLLEALVDANLLLQPAADRYGFHPLVWDHARAMAAEAGQEAVTVHALHQHRRATMPSLQWPA